MAKALAVSAKCRGILDFCRRALYIQDKGDAGEEYSLAGRKREGLPRLKEACRAKRKCTLKLGTARYFGEARYSLTRETNRVLSLKTAGVKLVAGGRNSAVVV